MAERRSSQNERENGQRPRYRTTQQSRRARPLPQRLSATRIRDRIRDLQENSNLVNRIRRSGRFGAACKQLIPKSVLDNRLRVEIVPFNAQRATWWTRIHKSTTITPIILYRSYHRFRRGRCIKLFTASLEKSCAVLLYHTAKPASHPLPPWNDTVSSRAYRHDTAPPTVYWFVFYSVCN